MHNPESFNYNETPLVSIETRKVMERIGSDFMTLLPSEKQDLLKKADMPEMGKLLAGGSVNEGDTIGVPYHPISPKLHAANDDRFQQAA